jgi:hypothetical protein
VENREHLNVNDFDPEFEKRVLAAMKESENTYFSIDQIVRRMAAKGDGLPALLQDYKRYNSLKIFTQHHVDHLVKIKKLEKVLVGTKQGEHGLDLSMYYRLRKKKRFGLF